MLKNTDFRIEWLGSYVFNRVWLFCPVCVYVSPLFCLVLSVCRRCVQLLWTWEVRLLRELYILLYAVVRGREGSVVHVQACCSLYCWLTSWLVLSINPALPAPPALLHFEVTGLSKRLKVSLFICMHPGRGVSSPLNVDPTCAVELLLVSTPLSVCPLLLHFPTLTPPVSAVCLAHLVEQPRSRRWRHQSTSSTTPPPLRCSHLSRRRAAPCSSCPATRARPSTSSMRSESLRGEGFLTHVPLMHSCLPSKYTGCGTAPERFCHHGGADMFLFESTCQLTLAPAPLQHPAAHTQSFYCCQMPEHGA